MRYISASAKMNMQSFFFLIAAPDLSSLRCPLHCHLCQSSPYHSLLRIGIYSHSSCRAWSSFDDLVFLVIVLTRTAQLCFLVKCKRDRSAVLVPPQQSECTLSPPSTILCTSCRGRIVLLLFFTVFPDPAFWWFFTMNLGSGDEELCQSPCLPPSHQDLASIDSRWPIESTAPAIIVLASYHIPIPHGPNQRI